MATRKLMRGESLSESGPKAAFSLRGLALLALAFGGGCLVSVPATLLAGRNL
jgi:hypothetical protein